MKTKEQIEAELNAIAARIGGSLGRKAVVVGVIAYGTFVHGNGEDGDEVIAGMVAAEDNPGITLEDMKACAEASDWLHANPDSELSLASVVSHH
jgi:hypothetical protein